MDFKLPSVGLAWSATVTDLDPRSRYRAFEASTMMALRKSLRRGSVWVNHSIGHRSSQSMLLADAEWTRFKEQHYQILALPTQASEFLAPILATMSVGVYALAEAVERDLLMEVDAATHFSEALLARRPESGHELMAVYGALLAHGATTTPPGWDR